MARDSSGKRLPWMRLWVRDLMGEPAVQMLSWDKRGRYIWALMCSWESDQPGVALQDDWFRWMGYNSETFESVKHEFEPLFFPSKRYGPDVWEQKRLQLEFLSAREESDCRTKASLKANSARWKSGRTPNGLRTESPPASESDTPKPKTKPSRASRSDVVLGMDLPECVDRESWRAFVEHRIAIKHPLTEQAAKLLLRRLTDFASKGYPAKELIEEAIVRGWRSVFAPETSGKASPEPTTDPIWSQLGPWPEEK